MRFEVTQMIGAEAGAVASAYASAELYQVLGATEKLSAPEVLSHRRDGETATLAIRYRFIADLPAAVTAVVDPARLIWIEHSVHDLKKLLVSVRLEPVHYSDRLRCSGEYRYYGEGDECRRVIVGDLRVKALLVASPVERAIVSGLREHLIDEARQTEAYLGSR